MTYRSRLMIAILLAATIPIAVLTLLIRKEVTEQLTANYVLSVESSIDQTQNNLKARQAQIGNIVSALSKTIPDDNDLRRAILDNRRDERSYLLDYASRAMALTGLSMLQMQDDVGRIISSGHFRNEYDRIDRALPAALSRDELALARVRAPEGPFVVLVAADTFEMGGRPFSITGGIRIEDVITENTPSGNEPVVRLITDFQGTTRAVVDESDLVDEVASSVEASDDVLRLDRFAVVRELPVRLIDTQRDTMATALIRISHSLSALEEIKAKVDRLFVVVAVVTGLIAVVIALWLASRMSRPITDLTDKASRVDLDRLHTAFKTDRSDEIGELSRVLRKMMERLRASASSIREAERRATRGELARQVNHDIKNGIAPVRNVVRHLAEVADAAPEDFAGVFRERQATLESGIAYLENLATNYARLTPTTERRETDVEDLVRRVASDFSSGSGGPISVRSDGGLRIIADPVALRRILENLVANALESTRSNGGNVSISAERVSESDDGRSLIRLTVADSGEGMTDEEISRAFQDFYSTREHGTGLGLSIVRRLVMDLGGTLNVESRKGEGSRFIVDLPETTGN